MNGAPDQGGTLSQIVAASGSSFIYGMKVLPARRRKAIFSLYAFCRVVDDIVDKPGDPDQKARNLRFWEDEIAAVYSGTPRTEIGRELARAAETYDLPQREFLLLIEGMRMDIRPIVAPRKAVLEKYVRRAAGTVGLLSMRVFGAWRGEPSRRFALALAEGMQLTNILRDVEEDAAMGRIYLPAEILAGAGIAADPATIAGEPHLPQARRALGCHARAAFGRALSEVPTHGRRPLIPALLMMGPYERLLSQMESDWTLPHSRPKWRKAIDGIRCVALGGGRA